MLGRQKRRLKEDIIAAFSSKMGGNSEDGARLFSEVHSHRRGGDRHMLQQSKVCQDKGIVISFSLIGVVKHEDRGPV